VHHQSAIIKRIISGTARRTLEQLRVNVMFPAISVPRASNLTVFPAIVFPAIRQ
jgi:hypothetical protein